MAEQSNKESDRTLLINGLAGVEGGTELKPFPNNLQLRNLELIFDTAGKLIRLRIHEGQGKAREYSVHDPQETPSVNEGSRFVLGRGIRR